MCMCSCWRWKSSPLFVGHGEDKITVSCCLCCHIENIPSTIDTSEIYEVVLAFTLAATFVQFHAVLSEMAFFPDLNAFVNLLIWPVVVCRRKHTWTWIFVFLYICVCNIVSTHLSIQGRILPWEPLLGISERRALGTKRKERVGFTTR